MKSLLLLIFSQKLTKGSAKKYKKNFKRKNAPSITLAKNLYLMNYIVFSFIFKKIYLAIAPKKSICQEVVVEPKVVKFSESKAVLKNKEAKAVNNKKVVSKN